MISTVVDLVSSYRTWLVRGGGKIVSNPNSNKNEKLNKKWNNNEFDQSNTTSYMENFSFVFVGHYSMIILANSYPTSYINTSPTMSIYCHPKWEAISVSFFSFIFSYIFLLHEEDESKYHLVMHPNILNICIGSVFH